MGDFEGTGQLIRLGLRRDRVMIPAWTAILVLVVVASASAVTGVYPTAESRVTAAEAVNSSAALVAMFGRIEDPTSLGAIAMVKMTAFGAAAVAILAIVITVRHSRADEEAGRLELLRATVVASRAPVAASVTIAVIASVVIGSFAAVGLIASGLPADGSLAFGAAWAGAGLAFTGIAALAAQISRTARGTTAISIGALGLAYILRAIGDTSDRLSWLTWASPLGWVHAVRAFAGESWAVLLLPIGFAVVTTAGAFVLAARRDLGAGLIADRPGPAHASRWLRGPLGLAWHLERGTLLVWAVAFAIVGVVVGGVAGDVGSFLNTPTGQDVIRRLGGEKGIVDAYLAAELGVVGLVIAAYGVHAALRLRTEELAERAEQLLATGVSRTRWVLSHLLVAIAGTTVLACAVGLSAGASRASQSGEIADLFAILGGALVQLPAVWVIVSIVVAAYGIGPRVAGAGWVALVGFVLLSEIGALLQLPERIIEVSPFAHTPKLPGIALDPTPLVVLAAVAVVFTVAGVVGFRRRDLH